MIDSPGSLAFWRGDAHAAYLSGQRQSHRDIGEIPEIVDPDRRKAATGDLRLFLETYFPKIFYLTWSSHHLRLIDLIQRAILEGLQQAIGFPRASGKTSIAQRAVLWATLCGHRKFAMLFGAEDLKSRQHTDAIWTEIETNDLLAADFPEICYPFRKTEGNAIRASRQLYKAEPTHIEISRLGLIFPTIPQSLERGNAGAVVGVGTITGAASRGPIVRGIRPDLALIDDPQTRKSAKSPVMVRERLNSINGDILGMAGPGHTVAALMTCTVIYREDLADQLLDRGKHAEWFGIRVKMLESPPARLDLWDQWASLIREAQLNEQGYDEAHAFYAEHREEMDAGAKVYWEDRRLKGYVSALESAMFLKYKDPGNFASEYQNEPETLADEDESLPGVEEICRHIHGCSRRYIPAQVDHLTAFVDIQQKLLFYCVVGWQKDTFTGYVIDYGTWPDQRRRYFSKADAKITIGHIKRGSGWEACLRHALEELVFNYLSRVYPREDKIEMRIEKGLIDANWGESTEVVYDFCRRHKLAPVWMPSHGMYVRAAGQGLNEGKRRPGERRGQYWAITRNDQHRLERIVFDSNWWKSFHCARWRTTVGDPGSMLLFTERDHSLFAEHLMAESGITVDRRGKRRTEWTLRSKHADNDWLDCMVGNCVAGSLLGCRVRAVEPMVDGTPNFKRITAENVVQFYG